MSSYRVYIIFSYSFRLLTKKSEDRTHVVTFKYQFVTVCSLTMNMANNEHPWNTKPTFVIFSHDSGTSPRRVRKPRLSNEVVSPSRFSILSRAHVFPAERAREGEKPEDKNKQRGEQR